MNRKELADALAFAQPLIVLGGKSRSGKSTLTNALKTEFDRLDRGVAILHADDYLGGESYRACVAKPDGHFPIEVEMEMKFEYERIVQDIQRLLIGERVRPPVYDRPTKTRVLEERALPLIMGDLLLFEGTIALAIPALLPFPSQRIYLEADDDARERELLHDWISVKGLSPQRAQELLEYRKRAEEPLIAAGRETAHWLVRRSGADYSVQRTDYSP